MKSRDNNDGCGIFFWGIIGAALVGIIVGCLSNICFHKWDTATFDEPEVKVCSKCGEIKEVTPPECTHVWSVRQEGDEFIAFCTNCDETKVAD